MSLEHSVSVCIFNMLCAINVYSEPNSHWWSEKEGERESAGESTACCCKREREREQASSKGQR